MAKRLFIGNLPYSATSSTLTDLFSQVGKLSSLNLITDKFSGQSKGFAFAEYSTDAEADEAIKKFNGHEVDGRKMVVNEARPQENRPNRDRNFDNKRSW